MGNYVYYLIQSIQRVRYQQSGEAGVLEWKFRNRYLKQNPWPGELVQGSL